MLRSSAISTFSFVLALLSLSVGPANRVQAQTYQIDCAILLCLSGGWPASAPCARARAEFIRRIKPWPVEPPLQIWRCPMGASFQKISPTDDAVRLYDVSFTYQNRPRPLFLPPTALLIQDHADIDISGAEFNFVRSIRVYHVGTARQWESGHDQSCNRYVSIRMGTYGTQGGFSWSRASPSALPDAHIGLDGYGSSCPGISHRSVFVEWRDFEGNYGFEQVNY